MGHPSKISKDKLAGNSHSHTCWDGSRFRDSCQMVHGKLGCVCVAPHFPLVDVLIAAILVTPCLRFGNARLLDNVGGWVLGMESDCMGT